jgi:hypothetical protein
MVFDLENSKLGFLIRSPYNHFQSLSRYSPRSLNMQHDEKFTGKIVKVLNFISKL